MLNGGYLSIYGDAFANVDVNVQVGGPSPILKALVDGDGYELWVEAMCSEKEALDKGWQRHLTGIFGLPKGQGHNWKLHNLRLKGGYVARLWAKMIDRQLIAIRCELRFVAGLLVSGGNTIFYLSFDPLLASAMMRNEQLAMAMANARRHASKLMMIDALFLGTGMREGHIVPVPVHRGFQHKRWPCDLHVNLEPIGHALQGDSDLAVGGDIIVVIADSQGMARDFEVDNVGTVVDALVASPLTSRQLLPGTAVRFLDFRNTGVINETCNAEDIWWRESGGEWLEHVVGFWKIPWRSSKRWKGWTGDHRSLVPGGALPFDFNLVVGAGRGEEALRVLEGFGFSGFQAMEVHPSVVSEVSVALTAPIKTLLASATTSQMNMIARRRFYSFYPGLCINNQGMLGEEQEIGLRSLREHSLRVVGASPPKILEGKRSQWVTVPEGKGYRLLLLYLYVGPRQNDERIAKRSFGPLHAGAVAERMGFVMAGRWSDWLPLQLSRGFWRVIWPAVVRIGLICRKNPRRLTMLIRLDQTGSHYKALLGKAEYWGRAGRSYKVPCKTPAEEPHKAGGHRRA
ncbi:hypothetical protein BKA70DRAFT_1238720 [Coprinopsis sp. MPI-PUGE-AT-0042]|nr:hypothetical protein BKA70DRAFT_1238720 [Coprinopsis sp. MPI-PUGE-AT-0042]